MTVKSNSVTINVAVPSCAPCQTYDKILKECTFLTPSSIGTTQPTVPQYLLGIEYNNFYGTGYIGWLNPANYTGTPCNNGLLAINVVGSTKLVKITGTVTDADGNPVADSGTVCGGLYKVYFGLTPQSASQSFNTGAGTATWDYEYSITDSSGNVLDYIEPDINGNFTVYLAVTIINYSFAASIGFGACTGPTTPLPFTVTVYFGFSANPSSSLNNGVQVMEYNVGILAKITA